MQGALSGDPSARTNTDRGGCITSLSFLPSTVGFFLSQPEGKPEKLSFLVSSTMQRIAAFSILGCTLESVWTNVGENMEMSRDIFMKKNARSTRGASTAGIWSSQFSIIPLNRERIPLSDLLDRMPGGEILDRGFHDRRKKRTFRRTFCLLLFRGVRSHRCFKLIIPLAVVSEFVSVILIPRVHAPGLTLFTLS